jgi:hypothetical protein
MKMDVLMLGRAIGSSWYLRLLSRQVASERTSTITSDFGRETLGVFPIPSLNATDLLSIVPLLKLF